MDGWVYFHGFDGIVQQARTHFAHERSGVFRVIFAGAVILGDGALPFTRDPTRKNDGCADEVNGEAYCIEAGNNTCRTGHEVSAIADNAANRPCGGN